MKHLIILLYVIHFSALTTKAQNVGIGTPTPRAPLSFSNSNGDKITFYHDGNAQGDNYGIGIQPGTFQFHTYKEADNFVFGFGNSGIFAERMKILNQGPDALNLRGRIVLKNGTTDPNNGSGIWFYNPDNSAIVGFTGVQNSKNLGFYGGPGGWGFTYDASNSYVGIGNNNPLVPLSFSSSLGKKISLYAGATGDAGFSTLNNELRIASDNNAADITFGYDNRTSGFTEKLRMKANGALSINGNTGAAGQVLLSNGSNSSPVWGDYGITKAFGNSSATFSPLNNNGDETTITSVTVTVQKTSVITIYGIVWLYASGCCGDATVYLLMNDPTRSAPDYIVGANPHVINLTTMDFVFSPMFNVTPGTYTFNLRARKVSGAPVSSGSGHDPNYQTTICTLRALVTPI